MDTMRSHFSVNMALGTPLHSTRDTHSSKLLMVINLVTYFMQISSNGATSIPCSKGPFLESTITTSIIEIPLTFGKALGSNFSSGWSFAPLLNLMGTLTLSMVMLSIVTFLSYPPLPLSVFIRIPAAESLTYKSSATIF